jgi:hypothetical protein
MAGPTRTASLLRTKSFAPLFILSDGPTPLAPADPRYLTVLPEQAPCVWQGHFALLTGPFAQVCDDDHHVYRRGEPLEICSKTLKVLESEPYRGFFAIINRAQRAVEGAAVSCDPNGSCC